jgi:hypothetical protein
MSAQTSAPGVSNPAGSYVGLVVGLGITAASMASGFIWASRGEVMLVYLAGFSSWTGYLVAHYAVTGVFVDDMSESEEESESGTLDSEPSETEVRSVGAQLRHLAPEDPVDAFGFVAGIVILVAGIALLAWFVRQENFLLGNIGSGMFLAGYAISHYFDSGKPL